MPPHNSVAQGMRRSGFLNSWSTAICVKTFSALQVKQRSVSPCKLPQWHRGKAEVGLQLYSFFNLGTRRGRWPTPRPGRFTPGNDPVPIVLEVRWAPGPVWTGAENLSPTGIRSPERSARRQSLYHLNYPGSFSELQSQLDMLGEKFTFP